MSDVGVGGGRLFYKMFSNSTGGTSLLVAGSSSTGAVDFYVTSTRPVEVSRVCLSAHGATPMLPEVFGAATSALANGVQVLLIGATSGTVLDFLDSNAIRHNADWSLLAGIDAVPSASTGVLASQQLPIRWTIAKSGRPLHMGAGEKLTIRIRDDISSGFFDGFEAMAQGWYS